MPSVLADFVANLSAETEDWDDAVDGRVILGNEQIVLAATSDDKVVIPLRSVFDVNVGETPKLFDPMPGTPVTLAYNDGMNRVAAVVAADDGTVRKFVTILFKALLNGSDVTIRHPAKVGGRVADSEYRAGILTLQSGSVQFETEDGPVTVGLDSVIDFSRTSRTVGDDQEPMLIVRHMNTGTAMTTHATTDSSRKLSLLGRYIQREYRKTISTLQQLSLSDSETEVLTTIYSAGDMDVSLANVLGVEPKRVKKLLHALHEKGLIESGDNGPVLTARGQIVVNQYLERVNA